MTRINKHGYIHEKFGALTKSLADGTLFLDRLVLTKFVEPVCIKFRYCSDLRYQFPPTRTSSRYLSKFYISCCMVGKTMDD
jgi:hypothetical protein